MFLSLKTLYVEEGSVDSNIPEQDTDVASTIIAMEKAALERPDA